ncbi:Aerobic respiration control sensor protein ArcB [Raoultella terrigena]|uniref:Aerobic respiration control sensor protein ArcB n=1 Tax=Raoultella terrigena TaxID=577 RepID=A0A4V6J1Z5_RAOTE|nr:Aerobic respiration control sensor protein ArcB [Raoultella terrigena]
MPGYLAVLESNLTARDQKGLSMKAIRLRARALSACATFSSLGQQIQTPDLPAWSDNVGEWVEEMKSEWQNDVAVLKAWGCGGT